MKLDVVENEGRMRAGIRSAMANFTFPGNALAKFTKISIRVYKYQSVQALFDDENCCCWTLLTCTY